MPILRTHADSHSFYHSGPTVWSSLTSALHNFSISSNNVKHHLFRLAFDTECYVLYSPFVTVLKGALNMFILLLFIFLGHSTIINKSLTDIVYIILVE